MSGLFLIAHMPIYPATETLAAITAAIEADQGGTYRQWLGKVIPHMDDAYRGSDDGVRSHLGGSLIGGKCGKQLWYGFRWALKANFSARTLRLFNRGHLEEARFIALLLTIGAQVYQQDEEGKQFRISEFGGHFGGSLDGILTNVVGVDPAFGPILTEFKTHSDKSFTELVKKGVQEAKFEHYVQQQVYMKKRNLPLSLYLAVNKNNDDLYGELIPFDNAIAEQYLDRAGKIIFIQKTPKNISSSPGWFECKWCDYRGICHGKDLPLKNCRTCAFVSPEEDGTWKCNKHNATLTKEQQLAGCATYELNESFVK